MKIITYLAFTVLSIAIQFVVMDLIQDKLNIDGEEIDLNETSPKKQLNDVLKQYAEKPHALYFRKPNRELMEKNGKIYSNSSIPDITIQTSTDLSSTVFDLLYDENSTVTEDSFTTEFYTSTEFDNVTEITLFGKNNTTTVKPKMVSKKTASKDCICNLMYKVCDINCCCDSDCTDAEYKMFVCGESESAFQKEQSNDLCSSQFPSNYLIGSNIDHLFCVVKHNLPDKRNIAVNKHDPSVIEKSFKWHFDTQIKEVQKFTKKLYKYGDPIWLLRNDTIFYIDLPTTMVNSYCTDRKPLRFLRNEKIKCNVKLRDLEVLQILSTAEHTSVITVTEKSLNTSTLNCSTLHCTNWTIILCDEATCTNYNTSLHDPLCTEISCTDLALKVDYTFYYYDNKIMNATIKLYTQKLPLNKPFLEQEINIKFIIGNESIDEIVELSGNLGYIPGLPVIVSHSEGNHTENFYKSKSTKYISYPDNINGMCTRSNKTNNYVLMGVNKRMKCRHFYMQKASHRNASDTCKKIQENITRLLTFDQRIAVAPLGNPGGLTDDYWIPMRVDTPDQPIYGELNNQRSKLYCYNIITRYSLIFTFVHVNDKTTKMGFKILSAKVVVSLRNITLNVEDISTVVTIDTIFIDETKPSIYEYAGGPQLNIHLPEDFFFPLPSNEACVYKLNKFIMFVSIVNFMYQQIL